MQYNIIHEASQIFENLPFGKYIFKVKGKVGNSGGIFGGSNAIQLFDEHLFLKPFLTNQQDVL